MSKSTYNSVTQGEILGVHEEIFGRIERVDLSRIKDLLSKDEFNLTLQTITPLRISTSSSTVVTKNILLTPFSALCVLYKYCPDKQEEILYAFDQMFNIFFKSNNYTNPVDSAGCTEFMWAVLTGNLYLIKKSHELIKTCDNYNVDQQDKIGRTALHVAVENNVQTTIIKYLINDVRITVDLADYQKKTDLLYAIPVHDLSAQGNSPQVYLKLANILLTHELLEDGASPNIPYHGKYLLSMLCEYIWQLKQIYKKSNNPQEQLKYGTDIKDCAPIVENLINKIIQSEKFDHTAKDADTGFTAVHWLCELGEKGLALLQELQGRGADINQGDVSGRSKLNWYCDYNALPIVTELLKLNKVNVNTQARNGETAVHALFSNTSKINSAKEKLPILKLLLNHDNKPPYDPTLKMSLNYNNKLIDVTAQDLLNLIIGKPNDDLNNCSTLLDQYKTWYDKEGVKLSEDWYNEQAAILGAELASLNLLY